jgi:hypothetical protein
MKGDVLKIISFHEDVHKIQGTLGSLEITKMCWKNCSTALNGQFQGKERYAAIGLKSVVSHNLSLGMQHLAFWVCSMTSIFGRGLCYLKP